MSETNRRVKLRLKIGSNELELDAYYDDAVKLVEHLLPYISEERIKLTQKKGEEAVGVEEEKRKQNVPQIPITVGESLTSILTRIFSTEWGMMPRSLRDVINALNSYGLYYPDSSVAVSLNRLVKRGILRRIKSKEGIFQYVFTGLLSKLDEGQ
ncbi:MAG: hypothetical protein QXH96_00790 [Candidatus Geothermarchaeota archaeon]